MTHTTRRRFLATAGAAVAAAVGLTGSASAAGVPALEKPDHVTLTYDRERLETYQPKMITSEQNRPRIKALYGYIAESSERDRTAYTYWLQLSHQSGLPLVSLDTHLGDHEPVVVFTNTDGTVDQVVYTAYHHYAGSLSPDSEGLSADRDSDPTHVDALRIVDPWHHYQFDPAGTGGFVDLNDWLAVRDTWAKNGFYENTSNEAVDNPYSMLERDSWWAEDTNDAQLALVWQLIGLGGARQADETRGSLL